MEILEKLTNNEIRLKCIEHGLPNVPVTDSSRKLLIKRLNDAINKAGPKENTQASNRRETINIAKAAPPPEVEVQKSRRTISAVSAKEDNAPTAIPIATRRRSVQKESAAESNKPIKESVIVDSILIEDDEDDIDLVNAADYAEKASTTSSVQIENITGRRQSRSASQPKVVEAKRTEVAAASKKRVMTPVIEDKIEVGQQFVGQRVKPQAITKESVNILSVQKLPSIESPIELTQQSVAKTNVGLSSHYSMQNTTPSVYSTPSSMRYTLGSSVSTAASTAAVVGAGYLGSSSAYRSKYLTDYTELSDNDAGINDDGCKSPFLSNFARDLERRRSVGRSTTGSGLSQYARRSDGSSYEKTAIRGRRSSKADLSISQIAVALARKYHLKTIFCLLLLVCIAIFTYIYLYA